MGKLKITLLAIVALAVPAFILTATTHAGSFREGNDVVIKTNQVVNHTVFAAGNNVEINGLIKGDVFCTGQNITVNATVEGDVICAGMNIEVGGHVMGDVRVAGQSVTLAGVVDNNASIAGSAVRTTSASKVGRDLQAGGSAVSLSGSVTRDADVAGDTVTINGTIGRDVQSTTSALRLDASAHIAGNVTYYSNKQLSETSGARVEGQVTRKQPETKSRETASTNPALGIIYSFFTLLTLAFVLLAIFPRQLKAMTDLGLTKPGTTVLIGLAASVGVPLLIIASMLTFIGLTVGIVLLLTWIVIMFVSAVLASYLTGRLVLMRSSQHPFVAMLTGVAILTVLMAIPFVNIFVMIAMVLFGSGMAVQMLFGKTPKPAYEHVSHPAKKTTRKS